ncbi:MAG: hypothetical protein NWE98_12445 [Candidatus Bathyarchaeota archaeon]|nr:hypothetical protein [Candidatus Bathyarchaeota archaeon]
MSDIFSFDYYLDVVKFIKVIEQILFNVDPELYFLTDLEQKHLIYQLLPTAREVGVSKELSGA